MKSAVQIGLHHFCHICRIPSVCKLDFESRKHVLLNDFEIYREQTEEMLIELTRYIEVLDSNHCTAEELVEAMAYFDERPALRLH